MNRKYKNMRSLAITILLLFSFPVVAQDTPWGDNPGPGPNDNKTDTEVLDKDKKKKRQKSKLKRKPKQKTNYNIKNRKNKRYLSGKVKKEMYKKQNFESNNFVGSVSLKFTGGFYNYSSEYENTVTGTLDTFGLPQNNTFSQLLTFGFELALRMGPDKAGFYNPDKEGFSYYRSNRGMFANIEIGYKTFLFNPGCYQRNDTVYIFSDSSAENSQYCNDLKFSNSVYDSDGVSSLDGVSGNVRDSTQNVTSKMTLFYLNSYYTATWINYIMNFGREYKWFDLSVGPSFRLASYSDYADPQKSLELENDSAFATVAVVARLYVKFFHPRARLRVHYYYPFYAQLARVLFKSKAFNQDEQTFNVGIDIMAIKTKKYGIQLTAGFETHIWKINQNSNERFNQGRPNLVQIDRISKEVYVGATFDFYL